jgi:alpha-tubulin suppressor-like RCC1 family protein
MTVAGKSPINVWIAGAFASLALLLCAASASASQVANWGRGIDTPTTVTGLEGTPTLIDAGNATGLAITEGGTAWAWGSAKYGALGNDTSKSHRSEVAASKVLLPPGSVTVAFGEDERSGFAILSTGHVFVWGDNKQGDLCLGNDTADQLVPVEIEGLSEVVEAAGAQHHILFRLANGTVKACGYNDVGQVGIPGVKKIPTPELVPGLGHVVELSAGPKASFARTASGEVLAFGSNQEGQLGLGKGVTKRTTPTRVPLVGPASEISAGGGNEPAHTFVLVEGVPYCFGVDQADECGDGSEAAKFSPTIASELAGLTVVAAHAAGQSSEILTSDGRVYTLGENELGELGDGGGPSSLTPVLAYSGAVEISATASNILAR